MEMVQLPSLSCGSFPQSPLRPSILLNWLHQRIMCGVQFLKVLMSLPYPMVTDMFDDAQESFALESHSRLLDRVCCTKLQYYASTSSFLSF